MLSSSALGHFSVDGFACGRSRTRGEFVVVVLLLLQTLLRTPGPRFGPVENSMSWPPGPKFGLGNRPGPESGRGISPGTGFGRGSLPGSKFGLQLTLHAQQIEYVPSFNTEVGFKVCVYVISVTIHQMLPINHRSFSTT